MSNHISHNHKPNVRGPYHGEGRMPSAPTGYDLEVRPDSTHSLDYAKQYQMPLGSFRSGNNGRTDLNLNGNVLGGSL